MKLIHLHNLCVLVFIHEQGVHYFFERIERRVNVCGQFVIVFVRLVSDDIIKGITCLIALLDNTGKFHGPVHDNDPLRLGKFRYSSTMISNLINLVYNMDSSMRFSRLASKSGIHYR